MRRPIATALAATVACAGALAQALQPAESQPADPRKNQKIERIHVEDNSVAIDEVRFAGQAESITVRPRDGLPAYEVRPNTAARQRLDDGRRGTPTGERVWNVFSF